MTEELIRRSDAKRVINQADPFFDNEGYAWILADEVLNGMNDIPTIEPKRGEWMPFEYGDYTWHKCSVCGTADRYIDEVPRYDGTIGTLIAVRNFCPNCGADMREVRDE